MKKKLITSALCLVLLVFMLLSSTLAWFTDTEGNVNTMTVGKIDITQTADFSNLQLMPTQKVNTEVTVKNTGDQPCYVRTLIAFEDKNVEGTVNTMLQYLNLKNGDADANITFLNANGEKVQFTADGITYTVGCFLYDGPLAAKENYTCLTSIQLDATAPNGWHTASGPEYKVLVLSQATQTTGLGSDAMNALNKAFAPITNEKCEEWFTAVLNGNN